MKLLKQLSVHPVKPLYTVNPKDIIQKDKNIKKLDLRLKKISI
jgi:hypothetical protein